MSTRNQRRKKLREERARLAAEHTPKELRAMAAAMKEAPADREIPDLERRPIIPALAVEEVQRAAAEADAPEEADRVEAEAAPALEEAPQAPAIATARSPIEEELEEVLARLAPDPAMRRRLLAEASARAYLVAGLSPMDLMHQVLEVYDREDLDVLRAPAGDDGADFDLLARTG